MRFLILSGNKKPEGLCLSVIQEIHRGASDGGAQASIMSLEGVGPCKNCNDGWGLCKTEHDCAFGKDGFSEIHEAIKLADALCVVLTSDSNKAAGVMTGFLDRLRNCESGQFGQLANKPVLGISFPKKPDVTLLSGLEILDRFCRQTGAVIFDFLGVQSWNSDYARASAYAAGKVMAYGRKADIIL